MIITDVSYKFHWGNISITYTATAFILSVFYSDIIKPDDVQACHCLLEGKNHCGPNNLPKIWLGVQEIISSKSTNSPSNISLKLDNSITSDPSTVSEVFNDLFSTIAEKVRLKIQKYTTLKEEEKNNILTDYKMSYFPNFSLVLSANMY